MKTTMMMLAALLCSVPAFQPALAETPAAACLTANGQRLYNIRPFRNIALPPGCRQGDRLVRFQLEQPGTIVRKLRNTLTTPGEQLLATIGGVDIFQVFDPDAPQPALSCLIIADVPGNVFVLGGLQSPEGTAGDIGVGPTDFVLNINFIDADVDGAEFPGSISGGPPAERQFFSRVEARCLSTMWSRSETSATCPMVASSLPPSALPRTPGLSMHHEIKRGGWHPAIAHVTPHQDGSLAASELDRRQH